MFSTAGNPPSQVMDMDLCFDWLNDTPEISYQRLSKNSKLERTLGGDDVLDTSLLYVGLFGGT
jgi:hypothetical protein